ncbi:sensor histidine kinase [Paenibacillus sp. NPDC057934]|uniref:sensor histidine kinase n=1 Tax=Paenibacillus sp. NPDC057934 TaxID=3346282 RepID=UPI0036DA2E25
MNSNTAKTKHLLGFKSLYAKLTFVFLSLWWGLNLVIMGVMLRVVTIERIRILFPVIKAVGGEFYNFILYTVYAFAACIVMGTIIIILVVRSIVSPIKAISDTARKVAKGDFDVSVSVQSSNELGMLAEDFNTMTRELKSIDALRSSFVSSVSHEFRTPITSIKGYVEMLHEDAAHVKKLTDEQRLHYCDIVLDESNRLIALSSDLLRLSELDSQVIREQDRRFSIDEQIRRSVVILEPHWSKKNIEFDLALSSVDYLGNKELLQQVWLNLIQNAIKFSNRNSEVSIRLFEEDGYLMIQIMDHGMGIAAAEQERIFESFYKAHESRSGVGNGLGLAIVKRIIEIMNGQISVESELGKGTTFTVRLPVN